MRYLAILILLVASSGALAGDFEFPKGVPVRAADCVFYKQTDHYQHQGTIHDRTYNISAAKHDPIPELYGNGNLEFPWKTGGIDRSPNAKGFTFYRLPGKLALRPTEGLEQVSLDARGQPAHWRDDAHYEGTYPEGSLFGEVLQTDGQTTEVRLMDKHKGKWRFRVFRPYRTRKDLDPYVVKEKLYTARLADKHPKVVFDATACVDEVTLSPEGVRAILARPFQDVTGQVFAEKNGTPGYAPSTTERHQIVPVAYQGAFLSAESCLKCHETVNHHVNEFQPIRDWYGRVRGYDRVFSYSPWASASPDGVPRRLVLDRNAPVTLER